MQVSVQTGEGLERKVTVEVPAEKLDLEVESRLKSMQGRVRIDGFRPGKVPLKIVKQRYGLDVLQEVASELIQSSFRDAVMQENLKPAGDPVIDSPEAKPGQALKFTATFEVLPEVILAPVNELKLEKLTAELSDSDVDDMIETLRKQRTDWSETDKGAGQGDRVTVDFKGTIDGELFDGGSANDVPVELGSGTMIPGFEDQLAGVTAGENKTLNVTFPDDYQVASLAGKKAEFAVTVKKVEQPQLPDVNEDFARSFGIQDGSIEKLRQEIRANLQRELDNRLRAELNNSVMNQLLEANPVDVPSAMVEQEALLLLTQSGARPGTVTVDAFRDQATRRVRLGILFAELVKLAGLQLDPARVNERLETMSREYEDPGEFVRYYQNNPEMMRSIESLVMEEMIVDWIIEQASVETRAVTFTELMKPA